MVVEDCPANLPCPSCYRPACTILRANARTQQLGLDYVCGTSLVAEELFSKILSGHGSHLDTFGDFEILRFSLDLSVVGMKFARVSELERSHGIRIVAFERRDGSASSIPTKDSVLYHGDSVLACVRHDLLGSFSKYMQM